MNATLFGNWVFYTYNQVKIRSYSIGGTQVQYDWYLLTKGEETGPERRTPCKDEGDGVMLRQDKEHQQLLAITEAKGEARNRSFLYKNPTFLTP